MIHMLDQVMNEHLAWDAHTRPRVSLVIDEAHTLITPDLMRMVAEHREAGFSVACATQYMSQIGANLRAANAITCALASRTCCRRRCSDACRRRPTRRLRPAFCGRLGEPDAQRPGQPSAHSGGRIEPHVDRGLALLRARHRVRQSPTSAGSDRTPRRNGVAAPRCPCSQAGRSRCRRFTKTYRKSHLRRMGRCSRCMARAMTSRQPFRSD